MAVSGLLTLTVPLLLAGVGLCGVLTGTDVFSALTDGARDGLRTVARIFPALVALLTAVSMLRASGALEALTRLCAPVLAWLGIPPETAMLLLVRPISGSGALAAASDIIQTYGADSRIGRTAAVMLGSTETTFYVLAVYFGACGIRHSRWAIPAAIVADVTGFVTAARWCAVSGVHRWTTKCTKADGEVDIFLTKRLFCKNTHFLLYNADGMCYKIITLVNKLTQRSSDFFSFLFLFLLSRQQRVATLRRHVVAVFGPIRTSCPPPYMRERAACVCTNHIFSGAVTPMMPRPISSTQRVASASFRRASRTAGSASLMRQTL